MLKRVQDPVLNVDMEPFDSLFTWWGALAPEVKKSYRSTAELAPSREYVAAVPMRSYHDLQEKDMSYEDYFARCVEIYGSGNIQLAKRFQDGLHQTYGDLLRYPGAFFILGTGERTIDSMVLQFDQLYAPEPYVPEPESEASAKLRLVIDLYRCADGDGTVPYFSASMAGRIDALSADRRRAYPATHAGILESAHALDAVVRVLRYGMFSGPTPVLPVRRGYTCVAAACPVEITLERGGEALSSERDRFREFASFGRMDLAGASGDIKVFCIENGSGSIRMRGTDAGTMLYGIGFFDADGRLLEERGFKRVAIRKGMVITGDTARDRPTVLSVDVEGDGKVDYVLTPDIVSKPTPGPTPDPGLTPGPTPTPTPDPLLPDPEPRSGTTDGGGGCDAGVSEMMLALVVAFLLWRKA